MGEEGNDDVLLWKYQKGTASPGVYSYQDKDLAVLAEDREIPHEFICV